jgi:hypothetical protein
VLSTQQVPNECLFPSLPLLSAASEDTDVPTWDEDCVIGHHLYSMDWVPEGEVGLSQQGWWVGQSFSARDGKVSLCPECTDPSPAHVEKSKSLSARNDKWSGTGSRLLATWEAEIGKTAV